MKESLKKLITQKKKLQTTTGGQTACPECGKIKPYGQTVKSPISGKHYCSKKCMDAKDDGQQQVQRMRELAGLEPEDKNAKNTWFCRR